jgi:hypothetical protein
MSSGSRRTSAAAAAAVAAESAAVAAESAAAAERERVQRLREQARLWNRMYSNDPAVRKKASKKYMRLQQEAAAAQAAQNAANVRRGAAAAAAAAAGDELDYGDGDNNSVSEQEGSGEPAADADAEAAAMEEDPSDQQADGDEGVGADEAADAAGADEAADAALAAALQTAEDAADPFESLNRRIEGLRKSVRQLETLHDNQDLDDSTFRELSVPLYQRLLALLEQAYSEYPVLHDDIEFVRVLAYVSGQLAAFALRDRRPSLQTASYAPAIGTALPRAAEQDPAVSTKSSLLKVST